MTWKMGEAGRFELWHGEQLLVSAYAKAQTAEGVRIDTRTAVLQGVTERENGLTASWSENGLLLTEELSCAEDLPTARCSLARQDGLPVTTRRLVPLVVQDDRREPRGKLALWKSLETRMLTVPYDNTMWLRFEALPLRSGRVSYDLTVLIGPDDREGLLLGALDFDTWKNAVTCSAYDARSLELVSGWADAGSHDTVPHGAVRASSVSSAGFCVLYGPDWRLLLERYGDVLHDRNGLLRWNGGSPFGFNSWAGLAWRLNEGTFARTGEFFRSELRPKGFENRGVTYINLDACWQPIGEDGLKRLRDEQHANGQSAGIYDAPFAFFGRDVHAELPSDPGHTFEELLLRDEEGRLLPRVDGAIPMDVTHPLWRSLTRWKLQRFIEWGYEYVKLDFLSHGGMEGTHHDPAVTTGRQALNRGYRYLAELLSPEKVGHPFFISLSIAPMLPGGWGHARRFSCDAFGTAEDVAYVLNAQTYGWWQNRRLYEFNDPDHIVLLRSFGMEEDSSYGEARARYTSAAIAGGVMMLSDDYDREEARSRARLFATNREVNEVARRRPDFRPVCSADAWASRAFCAELNGRHYLAMFSLNKRGERVEVDCRKYGLPEGSWRDLWTGRRLSTNGGVLSWETDDCDAMLLVKE